MTSCYSRVFSHQQGQIFDYLERERDEEPYFQQDLRLVCHGTVIALFVPKDEVGVFDVRKPL